MEYLGRVLSKMKCKIVEEVKILIFMNIILLSISHAKLALRENWFAAPVRLPGIHSFRLNKENIVDISIFSLIAPPRLCTRINR